MASQTVMTVFVVISALAMVAMAMMVFGIFKAMTSIREQMSTFIPKAEALVNTANTTLADNQGQIKEITTRAAHVLDTTQRNLVRVDEVVVDATQRVKVQLERLDLIMDDTVGRVHNTVVALNNTVLKPMREMSGVASGVKAAVQHLVRSNRPTPAQATSDEEMFI
jgi:flagellar biosynthesis protein FliQ